MNPTVYRTAGRFALALGLVAGVFPTPLMATPDSATLLPQGAATVSAKGHLIELAQASTDPVERSVSYSSEQADRGEKRFQKDCEDCHGMDLNGGINGGARLRGVDFEDKYANGASAVWLFEFMTLSMPPDAPGRFSVSTYSDLMAYILRINGFSEGAPLPSDIAALENLIMEK